MYPVKNPKIDLKLRYRKVLEIGMIVSLLCHIILFRVTPDLGTNKDTTTRRTIEIKVEDIPQTEQMQNRPVPPARPSIPVPTDDEAIPEDLTIASTEINLELSTIPPPPPMEKSESEHYAFIAYDEPPRPIGGYGEILRHLEYPEIARKAGVESTVIIAVLIDKHGNAVKTEVLKKADFTVGFEDAASNAVMKVKWKPAMQRDMPIRVWVSIPISFKLNDEIT